MLRRSLQLTTLVLLSVLLWAAHDLHGLWPYRRVLWHHYATPALLLLGTLFLNIFVVMIVLARHVTLGHTGQRLRHAERQVQTGHGTLHDDLTDRLEEDAHARLER